MPIKFYSYKRKKYTVYTPKPRNPAQFRDPICISFHHPLQQFACPHTLQLILQ